ncbi:MAG: DUF2087 domain-containing protein [Candidatus Eisenbacteria bacterium]|nr:DUF2087 domain-containing protein [Candidatus Eisenbacteria bacterium]
MTGTTITREEFEERIAALCTGGVGPGLPRKRRDRNILLRGVVLVLGHGRTYTEPALNDALESWLEAVGPAVRIDHVSLRRYLIDEGYVTRDAAGREYRVCASEERSDLFEPAVDHADVLAAVRAAAAERAERRSRRER